MENGNVLLRERLLRLFYRDKAGKKKKDMLFGELADHWLNNVRIRVKEPSYVKYDNVLKNHIIPELGQVLLKDFTTIRAETFVTKMLHCGNLRTGKGLAKKTVKDMVVILKEIYAFAACQGLEMPCHLELIKIRVSEKEVKVFDKMDQKRFEEELLLEDSLRNTGIMISLYMGLRVGEVCALRREDIDFDNKVLQVRATMQRIQDLTTRAEKKTKVIIAEPKSNSSKRDIPIPFFLLEQFAKMRNFPERAFLLTGREDKYIEPRSLENYFKSYLKKCDIAGMNYHVLRHTFATRCMEQGFDAKSLSEILGHASVNITLNRYVHSSMEQKRKHMEMLEKIK